MYIASCVLYACSMNFGVIVLVKPWDSDIYLCLTELGQECWGCKTKPPVVLMNSNNINIS